ncbi:beta-ketoacyl synthase [Patulibacter sp.]|uniref:beta-ketoacyl-[acyl-carrier-protein] synthase family protein n=1 Tax=Patulibacter sp. TaxID=1912859 RepID=UPI0027223451|nr:beta-ketoacyl-ACP synthase II [Patulibacter sp.]MDO9410606.1 beta-ketoacyl-ACP synthase II [Patulibacter sp.]
MTRAAITGVGAVTPLGVGADALYDGWTAGRSGIVDGEGACRDFVVTDHLTKKEARRADRSSQLLLAAGDEALLQAGWGAPRSGELPYAPERIATIIGSGIGGFITLTNNHEALLQGKPVSPLAIPLLMANGPTGQIALRHGLLGPSWGTVSACAAGAHAIGSGLRELRAGTADAVVVGGTEAALVGLARAGFSAMDALSPTGQSRPFHRDRDGFVLAEGAAALVIEDEEKAKARGATILGYLEGVGSSQDAHHLTAPTPDGSGASRAVIQALADAGLSAEDIDYVNAHGTGTPLNDRSETGAMRIALGDHLSSTPISSLKSAIGHTLGAAGAIEAVATTLALRDRVAPPTLNLDVPDPELDLLHVVGEPVALRETPGRAPHALSTSFGFGGHNACIVLGGAA